MINGEQPQTPWWIAWKTLPSTQGSTPYSLSMDGWRLVYSVSLWFLVHRYVLVCTDKIPKTCNEDKKHKYLYIWLRKTLLTRTLYILNTKCLPVLDLPIFRFVTLFCEGKFWVTWYIFRWRQYNNKLASTPHYEYSPRGEVQNYEISRLEREIRRLAEVRIINPCMGRRGFTAATII